MNSTAEINSFVNTSDISTKLNSTFRYCSLTTLYEYLEYSVYLQAVITALIVILNIIVVCIIARRKKITRLYCYLLNLAVADLTVGLVEVLPRTLERANSAVYLPQYPPLQLPLCRIQRCLGHMALVTSNLILAAMSIDRAQVVVSPMKRFKRGRLIQIVVVLLCWFVGLLCSVPITTLHSIVNEQCQIYITTKNWWKVYYLYNLAVQFLVPLVIIIVSYTVLLIGIYKRGIMSSSSVQSNESRTFNLRLPRSKLRSVKLTFGIIMSFVLCWTPEKLFIGIDLFTDSSFCFIVFITCLTYLNSIGNPICFFIFHYKKRAATGRQSPSTDTLHGFFSTVRDKLKWNGSFGSTRSTDSSRREIANRPIFVAVNNKAYKNQNDDSERKLSPGIDSKLDLSPLAVEKTSDQVMFYR